MKPHERFGFKDSEDKGCALVYDRKTGVLHIHDCGGYHFHKLSEVQPEHLHMIHPVRIPGAQEPVFAVALSIHGGVAKGLRFCSGAAAVWAAASIMGLIAMLRTINQDDLPRYFNMGPLRHDAEDDTDEDFSDLWKQGVGEA